MKKGRTAPLRHAAAFHNSVLQDVVAVLVLVLVLVEPCPAGVSSPDAASAMRVKAKAPRPPKVIMEPVDS